jgi:hypothetical protein
VDTTSCQIEDDGRAEIASDPHIPHPAEIAVEVVDGTATLRGTVGSFAQRHAAVADARRTKGVEYVDDWLQVRLLDRDRREDAERRRVPVRGARRASARRRITACDAGRGLTVQPTTKGGHRVQ